MQRILVCAQDPVLAKKVRFLMERDECKVDIVSAPGELEQRLNGAKPTLLVLSRELDADEDALDRIEDWRGQVDFPVTLVLGGQPRSTPDFVHLVPDPVDTQAIYREASRLLHAQPADGPATDTSLSPLDELGSVDALDSLDSLETLEPLDDEELPLGDEEDALGGIARELDALEAAEIDEQLSDAFSAEKPEPPQEPPVNLPSPEASGADATALDPAAFARALNRAWSEGQGGALVVERDGERTTVYFDSGRPVASRSSHPGDLLGKALVARGRLSEAQYADAAKTVVEEGKTLGDTIVELGFLSEEDLSAEMGTSARELLVGCFSAREGRFWREADATPPRGRRFELEVGHVIAQGLRSHADERVIDGILGERLSGYFKLQQPAYELQQDFPLSKTDSDFLAYEGRAYNMEDAADGAGLPLSEARRLIAILAVTDRVEPFQPGAAEFEERIRDERKTRRDLESRMPGLSGPLAPESSPPSFSPSGTNGSPSRGFGAPEPAGSEAEAATRADAPSPFGAPAPGSPPSFPPPGASAPSGPRPSSTASAPLAPPPAPPHASSSAPPPHDPDIPPMPVPGPGEGVVPRPLAYAKPSPREPDGSMLETPERNLSREHFQKGVGLLGKGNFSSAEEAFRDAVALCSEEHVYLIGLARAIYYNPSYRADGKLPILQSIVERAQQLAPDDKRVSTLARWVEHARERA